MYSFILLYNYYKPVSHMTALTSSLNKESAVFKAVSSLSL